LITAQIQAFSFYSIRDVNEKFVHTYPFLDLLEMLS
jgi:hypothetical protein